MSNPLRILQAVDARLHQPVELFLYGRAAVALGFENPPASASQTLDVDGIIPRGTDDQYGPDAEWWEAIQRANEELESEGLYLTHLFDEAQVILRPNWREEAWPLEISGLRFIAPKRPATIDLILTKMMRGPGDIEDMADVRFYLAREPGLGTEELQAAFGSAVGEEVDAETWRLFREAQPAVLKMAQEPRFAR